MALQNTLTICGAEYKLKFDKGGALTPPTLKLISATASGTIYTGRLDCSGCNFAIFSFYVPAVCTGARDERGPCFDTFRLQVDWECCPLAGWDGPGWYCITAAGGDCAGAVAVELLDIDKCRSDIKICSGPYATKADAEAVCGSGPLACGLCPGGTVSTRLKITIAGSSNYDGDIIARNYFTSGGGCYWKADAFFDPVFFGSRQWTVGHSSATVLDVVFENHFSGGLPAIVYYSVTLGAPWDCLSPVTLNYVSQDDSNCGGCTWPATITLAPY